MRYLIVGAGPCGLTIGRLLHDAGHQVRVIEKRDHLGGNAADQLIDGVRVHRYGMHLFHTSDDEVWQFVNRYSAWTPYEHRVLAETRAGVLPLPFGLPLYHRLYGITRPSELAALRAEWALTTAGDDLESWARSQIGDMAYELVVRGYTEKQWGRPCAQLPRSILQRLPIRMTWDTRYFTDRYQAIPTYGYQRLWGNLAQGLAVDFGVDFFQHRDYWEDRADRIVYTGPLDQFWGYQYGRLQYRSLDFETTTHDGLMQGCPVLNNGYSEMPYTRTYEWVCLPDEAHPSVPRRSVLTRERPAPYMEGMEPYYPVRTPEQVERAQAYLDEGRGYARYVMTGRLGTFRYYDMHQVIRLGMTVSAELLA